MRVSLAGARVAGLTSVGVAATSWAARALGIVSSSDVAGRAGWLAPPDGDATGTMAGAVPVVRPPRQPAAVVPATIKTARAAASRYPAVAMAQTYT